jgi:hypothetical protein
MIDAQQVSSPVRAYCTVVFIEGGLRKGSVRRSIIQ